MASIEADALKGMLQVIEHLVDDLAKVIACQRPRRCPATTSIAIADSAPSRTETKIVITRCSPRSRPGPAGSRAKQTITISPFRQTLAMEESVFLTGD